MRQRTRTLEGLSHSEHVLLKAEGEMERFLCLSVGTLVAVSSASACSEVIATVGAVAC